MTDFENAERMRKKYLTQPARKNVVNICRATPNWNGCDYCDAYAGCGLECWKQDGKHDCAYCTQEKR